MQQMVFGVPVGAGQQQSNNPFGQAIAPADRQSPGFAAGAQLFGQPVAPPQTSTAFGAQASVFGQSSMGGVTAPSANPRGTVFGQQLNAGAGRMGNAQQPDAAPVPSSSSPQRQGIFQRIGSAVSNIWPAAGGAGGANNRDGDQRRSNREASPLQGNRQPQQPQQRQQRGAQRVQFSAGDAGQQEGGADANLDPEEIARRARRAARFLQLQQQQPDADAQDGGAGPNRISRSPSPPPGSFGAVAAGNAAGGFGNPFQQQNQPRVENDAGMGMDEDGYVDPEAGEKVVGSCEEMCPDKEFATRCQNSELHPLERVDVNDARSGSRDLVVKKSVRTYYDLSSQHFRTFAAMTKTMNHLRRVMDWTQADHPAAKPVSIHGFLWDRYREIRKESTAARFDKQPGTMAHVIGWNEEIARFHLICAHELVGLEGFDVLLNQEQLSKVVTDLLSSYSLAKSMGVACPNSAEFKCYYSLMLYGGMTNKNGIKIRNKMDAMSVVRSFTNEEQASPWYTITRAILRCWSQSDISGFWKLAKSAPYVLACVMFTQHTQVQNYAMTVAAAAYGGDAATPRHDGNAVKAQVVGKWMGMAGKMTASRAEKRGGARVVGDPNDPEIEFLPMGMYNEGNTAYKARANPNITKLRPPIGQLHTVTTQPPVLIPSLYATLDTLSGLPQGTTEAQAAAAAGQPGVRVRQDTQRHAQQAQGGGFGSRTAGAVSFVPNQRPGLATDINGAAPAPKSLGATAGFAAGNAAPGNAPAVFGQLQAGAAMFGQAGFNNQQQQQQGGTNTFGIGAGGASQQPQGQQGLVFGKTADALGQQQQQQAAFQASPVPVNGAAAVGSKRRQDTSWSVEESGKAGNALGSSGAKSSRLDVNGPSSIGAAGVGGGVAGVPSPFAGSVAQVGGGAAASPTQAAEVAAASAAAVAEAERKLAAATAQVAAAEAKAASERHARHAAAQQANMKMQQMQQHMAQASMQQQMAIEQAHAQAQRETAALHALIMEREQALRSMQQVLEEKEDAEKQEELLRSLQRGKQKRMLFSWRVAVRDAKERRELMRQQLSRCRIDRIAGGVASIALSPGSVPSLGGRSVSPDDHDNDDNNGLALSLGSEGRGLSSSSAKCMLLKGQQAQTLVSSLFAPPSSGGLTGNTSPLKVTDTVLPILVNALHAAGWKPGNASSSSGSFAVLGQQRTESIWKLVVCTGGGHSTSSGEPAASSSSSSSSSTTQLHLRASAWLRCKLSAGTNTGNANAPDSGTVLSMLCTAVKPGSTSLTVCIEELSAESVAAETPLLPEQSSSSMAATSGVLLLVPGPVPAPTTQSANTSLQQQQQHASGSGLSAQLASSWAGLQQLLDKLSPQVKVPVIALAVTDQQGVAAVSGSFREAASRWDYATTSRMSSCQILPLFPDQTASPSSSMLPSSPYNRKRNVDTLDSVDAHDSNGGASMNSSFLQTHEAAAEAVVKQALVQLASQPPAAFLISAGAPDTTPVSTPNSPRWAGPSGSLNASVSQVSGPPSRHAVEKLVRKVLDECVQRYEGVARRCEVLVLPGAMLEGDGQVQGSQLAKDMLSAYNASLEALSRGVHATANHVLARWGMPAPEIASAATRIIPGSTTDISSNKRSFPGCWQAAHVNRCADVILKARVALCDLQARLPEGECSAKTAVHIVSNMLHEQYQGWLNRHLSSTQEQLCCHLLPRYLLATPSTSSHGNAKGTNGAASPKNLLTAAAHAVDAGAETGSNGNGRNMFAWSDADARQREAMDNHLDSITQQHTLRQQQQQQQQQAPGLSPLATFKFGGVAPALPTPMTSEKTAHGNGFGVAKYSHHQPSSAPASPYLGGGVQAHGNAAFTFANAATTGTISQRQQQQQQAAQGYQLGLVNVDATTNPLLAGFIGASQAVQQQPGQPAPAVVGLSQGAFNNNNHPQAKDITSHPITLSPQPGSYGASAMATPGSTQGAASQQLQGGAPVFPGFGSAPSSPWQAFKTGLVTSTGAGTGGSRLAYQSYGNMGGMEPVTVVSANGTPCSAVKEEAQKILQELATLMAT